MNTNNSSVPWRRITATAIGASAIAVGTMVLSAPAANAIVTWETKCPQNPEVFRPDALSGVFRISRDGNDRFEFCDLYSVEGVPPDRKPGGTGYLTTHAQWFPNWYHPKSTATGVPPRVSQPPQSPPG